MTRFAPLATASLVVVASVLSPAARADETLHLIPAPKELALGDGAMALTPDSRIVVEDEALLPLAKILAHEIDLIAGRRLDVGVGAGRAGGIVLAIDPSLRAGRDITTVRDQAVTKTRDYAHRIEVTDRAIVTGFDYRAVAEGTATILQALRDSDGSLQLPRMTVQDWPEADFMAIMVDVARQEVTLDVLRQVVDACRFYKVRYCQLHLSDDQGWTFPSKAYPQLGTKNSAAHGGIVPKVYDLDELKALVAYADARGVTFVPELETPGHSDAARLAMPDELDLPERPGSNARLAIMNVANDGIYPILDTLVGEIAAVFASSPYFHVGCDETRWDVIGTLPQTQAYMQAHGIASLHDLFVQHVRRMNDIVRKHGKMTIVWEGAATEPAMRDQVIMMTWIEGTAAATHMHRQGFTTITVPWTLTVPWPQWHMYICNGSQLSREDRVLGALMPMWEMSGPALLRDYLPKLPRRHARTWTPEASFEEEAFVLRAAATEARLARLIRPVTIRADNLMDLPDEGRVQDRRYFFNRRTTIALDAGPGIAAIHYTRDGTLPTTASPRYDAPLALDGDAYIVAAGFDADGRMRGGADRGRFHKVDFERNLTTGKPVTVSGGTQGIYAPEKAVDGLVSLDSSWWASPGPQWLTVDLQQTHALTKVQIFTYWDGQRYYQYHVELSADGQAWTKVADMSSNTQPSSPSGDTHVFDATPARYLRVNLLKGSAHAPAHPVHLVEVRAYAQE